MDFKRISLLLLFMLFAINAETQKHPQLRYLSFDAGLNMSGLRSANQYDRHEKNFGPNISITGNYSFSDLKSVSAALAFDQKGGVDHVHDVNTNLNYLSLPVYMKWMIGKEPRFVFTTGIYASWLISANKRGEQFINGQVTRVNENITGNFRAFDGGLIMGTGMMIRLYDDFDFIITIRGSAGLFRIENNPDNNPRNYHFNVSLGYVYYLGFR